MFARCEKLQTIDVSSFDTEHVENMMGMFNSCGKLRTIYASDKFVTTNANGQNATNSMFYLTPLLEGGAGTTYATAGVTDGRYAVIDSPETPGYFTAKP